ncbi:hypothetical protein [Anaerocolumna sp.]|uniref:hypothetical protein n=1 Tax=Anaerocolumna sp. TaxID=2041569 RepID=UPI0028A8698B|nr:hypothetical protein [Anaerocolumna sp.]
MKKFFIIISVSILFIFISIIIISNKSVKNNDQSLINFFKKNEKEVKILRRERNENDLFVLYQVDNGDIFMKWFTQYRMFRNYYRPIGEAFSSTKFFNTYNTGNPEEALIVLYGDNSSLNAHKVEFSIDNITISENISNIKYVLSVYRFYKKDPGAANIKIFDTEGKAILNDKH